MTPKSSSTTYLSQASKAVYDAMVSADEKAIWLMQGWLFVNDPNFWQIAQVEAYLKGLLSYSTLGPLRTVDCA